MRIPIRRVVGMVLGETDGEFLTEFQNFQNFCHGIAGKEHGYLAVIACHSTGGRVVLSLEF